MAIFKPEMKESNPNRFYGVCELKLEQFEEKSDLFDWADIFIDVVVRQKGSEYTRNIKLAGSFDKDSNGNITGGSVLKRMYKFFDVIGCTAGLNVKGTWESEEGIEISNIAEYLNDNFITPINDYDYIGYVYKELPKKPGDKAWTRVYPKIYQNTTENKLKLYEDIKWLKGKGYLKEFTDEPANSSGENLEESAIANL